MDESWEASGIYMLTCRVSGKRYIGQSKNIKRRLNAHRRGKSSSPIICNAIAKFGCFKRQSENGWRLSLGLSEPGGRQIF